jgi:hypothetical protein
MKYLSLVFLFFMSSNLVAAQGNLTDSQITAVQSLIIVKGYKCDTVNFAMRSNWDGSIRVTCNDNRYVYELKDVGGNWTVKVQ